MRTSSPARRRRLVIEARDLDTDARERRVVEVEAPRDDAGRRAQLVTVVARLHSDAALRTYAAGAASFLGRQQLVVAHYADDVAATQPPRREAPAPAPQGTLFSG